MERGLALLTERSNSSSEPLQNADAHFCRMSPEPKLRMDQKKTLGQIYSGVATNFHTLDTTSS